MSSTSATILIVDDLPDNRTLLECLLEDDYRIACAESGQGCLEYLQQDPLPSLILLDLRMPEMDGFEVCTKLKSKKRTKNIPIIFVTAETGQEEKLKAYELGGDDFVSKPFDQDELLAKVRRNIASKQELDKLEQKIKSTKAAAMEAMNASSELGLIIQFMEHGTECEDYNALAVKLMEITEAFGVIASFQFTNGDMVFNIGNGCDDGTLEAKLLTVAKNKGRIVGDGQRVFFNQPHVSMLIKNMPVDDPDTYGRMKDNLAVLMSAAESVAKSIAFAEAMENQRRGGVLEVIDTCHQEMKQVSNKLTVFGEETSSLLQGIRDRFEDSLMTLGLTEQQEEYLLNLFDEGYLKIDQLREQESQIEHSFETIAGKMKGLLD